LPDPLSVYRERAIESAESAVWIVSLLASGEGDKVGRVGKMKKILAHGVSS
jgi:hypothetical protein